MSFELSQVPMPRRFQSLPRDPRGYPVPWFVGIVDGVADFRVIGVGKVAAAHREGRCWLCGQPRGAYLTFVIGPMCAINRVSSEPPSHRECAEYAARVCPFLARPHARRREADLPADVSDAPGVGLKRNPGVTLVWTTRGYLLSGDGRGGVLFRVGDPTHVQWFAEGRAATRSEVLASIESGLPLLREPAAAEGPSALAALQRMTTAALTLVPQEV